MVQVYSLKADGEKRLSRNFKVREFRCMDATDVVLVDDRLVWVLQQVRDHFKRSVIITPKHSGYRTPAHNASVKGSANSQHIYGKAADFHVEGFSTKDVVDYLNLIMPESGGIGVANTYVHVDVRDDKARWTY